MKKVLIILTTMFALMSAPLMAESESSFGMKMKSEGFRWMQNADQLGDFWGSENNGNYARVFGTAYIGSESHQLTAAFQQNDLSGPWDVFQGRDSVGDRFLVEYQFNFDK